MGEFTNHGDHMSTITLLDPMIRQHRSERLNVRRNFEDRGRMDTPHGRLVLFVLGQLERLRKNPRIDGRQKDMRERWILAGYQEKAATVPDDKTYLQSLRQQPRSLGRSRPDRPDVLAAAVAKRARRAHLSTLQDARP